MTSTPGWSRSHVATVSAVRSGRSSIRSMLFEIHQDRAIDPPLAEGKIIDAQDPGRGLGRRRRATENPQDRLTTEGHPQAGGPPRAGFAARLAPEDADRLGQPPSTLRVAGGKRWEAFGKGPARTRGGGTAETPDVPRGGAQGAPRRGGHVGGVYSGYARVPTGCDNPDSTPRAYWHERR